MSNGRDPQKPSSPLDSFRQAQALHRAGRLEEAERLYRAVLAAAPDDSDALHFLGVLEGQRGRQDAALALIDRAIALKPNIASFHYNRANVLREANRLEEAVAGYDHVIRMKPDHAGAWINRGTALQSLGRPDEALLAYDRALAIDGARPDIHANRGGVLAVLGRHPEALLSFDRALALNPHHADSHYGRGNVLLRIGRHEEALSSYGQALALAPDHAEALTNRGTTLMALGRYAEALADYSSAIALKPDHGEALYGRASALLDLKRHDEAIAAFEDLLARADYPYARGLYLHAKRNACDWRDDAAAAELLLGEVRQGKRATTPLALLAISHSAQDNQRAAAILSADKFPASPEPLWRGERYGHDRIRVAYLSADFRNHPVAQLMAGVFERHDRSRFDTMAVSFAANDGSATRKRLEAAFPRFIDVRGQSDRETAQYLRQMEVDIAVDLSGFTAAGRPGILAFRATPVQVNYLGFSGTMGTDYFDYIVADKTVIPESDRRHYSEKIVYLPDTYLPNDSTRPIPQEAPTRAEMGLPPSGFVFCCFNNNYKINPKMFDIWMRCLRAVEGSVLWLLQDNAASARNLRREGQARGIAAERILFAERVAPDKHLARHVCADLFLDTLPYNAHATAGDALWAGLPVVTCLGETLPGRVAASLLRAAGLPELITASLEDYEALALKLARDPVMLGTIKEKLTHNRTNSALFDTARFTRHFEMALTAMRDRSEAGLKPESFAVEPIRNPA